MMHVVFNEADVAVLQAAISLDESLLGEVLLIADDYAVGPLASAGDEGGWAARRQWWLQLLQAYQPDHATEKLAMVDDALTVHKMRQKLEADPQEVLWIWAAQNKHDVCGYYWLVSQLQPWQGRIHVLYLNNLPFFNEKGAIFFPEWLSQIPPREFLKAKKLARPVTLSEFEIDILEWQQLCASKAKVRLLEGGKKLIQKGEDYYDNNLDKYVTGDFIRAQKIIQQFQHKEKETTGEVFLAWRLRQMMEPKGYETKGNTNASPTQWELRHPGRPAMRRKEAGTETGNFSASNAEMSQ